jgi:hypothetical protein
MTDCGLRLMITIRTAMPISRMKPIARGAVFICLDTHMPFGVY